MPDTADLLQTIVTFMRTVSTAGTVHDRLRSVRRSQREYAKLAQLVPHETDGYRGWFLQYLFSTDHENGRGATTTLAMGEIETHHRLRLLWILPFNDSAGSSEAHARMFWDMAELFRTTRSFGYGRDVVTHLLLQGQAPQDPVELSELKGSMHVGVADLTVVERRTVHGC